jgi:hypothetical protein
MTGSDPRQVLIDYLSTPSIPLPDPPASSAAPSTGGWRASVSRGGMGAKAETMQFIKERHAPGRKLLFVTYEDDGGRTMHMACLLMQNEQGEWRFAGGAGGGGRGPVRSYPWANLGGGGWPNQFYAGGYVIDNGLDVVRVRLTAANGTVLEDSVDDGVVLFVTDQPVELPLQAELYDRTGKPVGGHSVF